MTARYSDLWELEEGFCVCSAARSDGSLEAVYRFDWVYAETGSCYPLLEGPYNPQMVKDVSPGAISVEPADDPLHILSAALDPALADVTSGESLSGSGVVSAATISVSPREYGLEWRPLVPELGDGSPLTIPGGGGTSQSLNGVYAGADSLDLLFDGLGQGAPSQIQITYDPDARELTLLCRNAPLNCQASASNLFIDRVRTEAIREDTAVICTLTPPAVPDRSQYATSIALEEVHPDDLDRDEVILRITFHSPQGIAAKSAAGNCLRRLFISSSLRTARNASVGICTDFPGSASFSCRTPQGLWPCGGPAWDLTGPAEPARPKVFLRKTLDAALAAPGLRLAGRQGSLIQLEDRQERLRGNLDTAQGAHLLFALLLLFQQLLLPGDVAAVALGQHVLPHGLHGLPGDDPAADGRLDRHLEQLPGDVLLQLLAQPPGPGVRLVLVGDEAQGVHHLPVELQVHLHQLAGPVAGELIVQGGVALGVGLQGVEEVVDDLVQGHLVVELHQVGVQVLHILELAPAVLAHGHDVAHDTRWGR